MVRNISHLLFPVSCCRSPVVVVLVLTLACGPKGAGSSSPVGESTYSESGSGSGSGAGAGAGAGAIDEDEALRRALVARHRGDVKAARQWAERAGERGKELLEAIERGERVD